MDTNITSSNIASSLLEKSNNSHKHTIDDIANIFNLIYPIGSIYLSFNSTDPNILFGGIWEPITGKFLYCNSSTDTGGSNSITLSTDNLPLHSHSLDSIEFYSKVLIAAGDQKGGASFPENYSGKYVTVSSNSVSSYSKGYSVGYTSTTNLSGNTGSTGSGSSFSIMPPYQSVYAWKRIE